MSNDDVAESVGFLSVMQNGDVFNVKECSEGEGIKPDSGVGSGAMNKLKSRGKFLI